MKLLLLGPTGSGKGTQSQLLLKELQIAHISTGDILRNEIAKGSQLGLKAKSIMDAGQLMQDEIIIAIVLERVKAPDCKRGFLLDGFPVYGPKENGLTISNADLDTYHGHSAVTADYPAGIYHYHITADATYINGSGFYGTKGTVTQ